MMKKEDLEMPDILKKIVTILTKELTSLPMDKNIVITESCSVDEVIHLKYEY